LALVPTMGYLHAGHAALLREGRRRAEVLVATIFVNPTQFGPGEDLDRYPRDLEGDLKTCREAGVDLVFAPEDPKAMYPDGFQTYVEVGPVAEGFCGASRPGHFRGVATVVNKLFNLVRPDVAVFGQKDFQQLALLRTMVRDFDMDIEIVGAPTVREADGLAMSSRNAYLGEAARARAVCLFRGLKAAQAAYAAGERRAGALIAACRAEVASGADAVDYVGLADPDTLEPVPAGAEAAPHSRLLVAAFLEGEGGRTRLIDNAPLRAD
jgi:pantoate--beta-alanine ligase